MMTDHKTKLLALLLAAMLALPAPGVAFAEAPDAAPAGGDVKVPTLLQADLGNGEDIRELFEDVALYNAVREAANVGDDQPLTLDAAQGVEFLFADDLGITSLKGLECLTNLIILSLEDNQLTDISPLANLTQLGLLFLDDNQLTDLSPLKDLNNLNTLHLDGNQLIDLSPLKDLNNLETLYLDDNQLIDLSPLKNLNNLKYLSLDGNRLTDISPLKGLTGLEILDLADNNLSDVSDLSGMVNLLDLTLSGNPLTAEHLESVLPEEFKESWGEDFDQWLEETLHGSTPPDDGGEDKPTRRDNDDGDYYGVEKWDEVKRQIRAADEGDTIKVSATGLPYFPSSVAREMKGKDITLQLRKHGVTYTVNAPAIG